MSQTKANKLKLISIQRKSVSFDFSNCLIGQFTFPIVALFHSISFDPAPLIGSATFSPIHIEKERRFKRSVPSFRSEWLESRKRWHCPTRGRTDSWQGKLGRYDIN
jgi:hypothetical protein